MTETELFVTALREIDKTAGAPPGQFEVVIRNGKLHGQPADAHEVGDDYILDYYKLYDAPRFSTRDLLQLFNNIAKFKKEGVL